jgi:large subunit ribosomal protein L22
MTPRKTRSVSDLVKGLSANEAEAQLILNPRRAAKPILKLLRSALANAKGAKLDPEKLFIKTITVNQGKMLKRYLPRARGSASPIQKKMSHITLVLEENPKLVSRFKIAIAKKTKASEDGKKGPKSDKPKEEKNPQAASKDPGIVKRIFHRKTGTA